MPAIRLFAPALAAGWICCAVPALAQTGSAPITLPVVPGIPAGPPEVARWQAVFSPYTFHYSDEPGEHERVVLFGLQREWPDGLVLGAAVFDNSFGQLSTYVFGGQRLYRWSPWDPLYAEWSVGLLYGYRGEFQHKVPLNYNGFSPGFVAAIGWQFTRTFAGQIYLLGTAGLMFSVTAELP